MTLTEAQKKRRHTKNKATASAATANTDESSDDGEPDPKALSDAVRIAGQIFAIFYYPWMPKPQALQLKHDPPNNMELMNALVRFASAENQMAAWMREAWLVLTRYPEIRRNLGYDTNIADKVSPLSLSS